jgi:protein phosphatase
VNPPADRPPDIDPNRPKVQRLTWSACTDRGHVRPGNEDSFLGVRFDGREIQRLGKHGDSDLSSMDAAFAVCDGMGGELAGEFASRAAVEKLSTLMPRAFKQAAQGLSAGHTDVLGELVSQIHKALTYLGQSYEECSGMQTTLSLAWFTPHWMYFAHVGDSRIYHLPGDGGPLRQVTQDDTHVGWLLRTGQITPWQARTHPRRSALQKALGAGNQFVEPQLGAVGIEPGDLFLLCTDGLVDGLLDERITEHLRNDPDPTAPEAARRIVEASLAGSGRDNTTGLIVRAHGS